VADQTDFVSEAIGNENLPEGVTLVVLFCIAKGGLLLGYVIGNGLTPRQLLHIDADSCLADTWSSAGLRQCYWLSPSGASFWASRPTAWESPSPCTPRPSTSLRSLRPGCVVCSFPRRSSPSWRHAVRLYLHGWAGLSLPVFGWRVMVAPVQNLFRGDVVDHLSWSSRGDAERAQIPPKATTRRG